MVNSMREWFNINKENVVNIKQGKKYRDVFILDEIGGYGIYAKNFIQQLNNVDADVINLHMDSVGGNITDGIAMYNALRGHKAEVHVYINGIAGSIASIIILAGDKIYIPENAGIFLHLPMYAEMDYPNRKDMEEAISILGNFEKVLTNTYMKHTGKDEDYIKNLLEAETWLFGQDAVDFIGDQAELVEKVAMVARIKDLEKYPISATLPKISVGEQDETEVIMKDEVKAEVTEEVVEATEEAVEEIAEESSAPIEAVEETTEEVAEDGVVISEEEVEQNLAEASEEEEEEVELDAEEVLALEIERKAGIMALSEKYSISNEAVIKALAGDVSVADFKDQVLDILASKPATKKIVDSSSEVEETVDSLREKLANATTPQEKFSISNKISKLRFK
tara:strand:- start:874 stop:2055 length:1182 start_codon:yes stop_codon:yes gene_type:complete